MASNKLKTYIGYNPTNVEGFSTKEKRAAFSKLRAIANKRLEKMERYDYKQNQYYKDLTNMFKSSRVPTLDAISDKKLDKALSEVSYFLRGLTTIQKIHAYENKQIKKFRDMGFKQINRKNLKKFGNFMESLRQRYGDRLKDSFRAVRVFEAAERLHINPNVLYDNMSAYNTELEVWEKVKPFESGRKGYSAFNYRKRYREALQKMEG